MSYSGSKRWILGPAVLALSASTGASRPPLSAAPPAAVRPAVALLVAIEATDYLKKVNDMECARECRIVRDALADSTLAIVRGAYPFLNWDDPQHATDTINVRLTSRTGDTPWIMLELRVLSARARMPSESTLVDFENFKAFHDRDDRNDWSADSLRREWAKRLREKLQNENLVESVFGQIPINAPAKVVRGRWHVGVAPKTIRQASYQTPTFEIRTLFRDPVEGADSVSVRLAPCMHTDDWKGYNCAVSRIVFGSQKVASGASLDSVLLRASLDSVSSIHLVTFKADTAAGGIGGAKWH